MIAIMLGSWPLVLPQNSRYIGWDAQLEEGENECGKLRLTIPPDNASAHLAICGQEEISVVEDERVTWRGRIVAYEVDAYGNKKITANGFLDYLHNTLLQPGEITGTQSEVFKKIVQSHNAKFADFSAKEHITAGNTMAASDEITLKISSPLTSWDAIAALIKEYGGYIVPRRGESGGNVTNTVDYLLEYDAKNQQRIIAGENLLDYTMRVDASEVKTVLYAYGKEVDGNALTMESANAGKKYIEDADAIAKYGRIETALVDTSIETAEALKAAAEKALADAVSGEIEITAEVADGSYLEKSVERIEVGHLVQVFTSEIEGEWMPVRKIVRNLLEPWKTTISVGATPETASEILRRSSDDLH